MKILLLGDFSENYDEGLKNIAKNFFETLSLNNDVEKINIKNLSIREIFLQKNDYDVIHYFTAPTTSSLVLIKLLSIRFHAKSIVSALHPDFSSSLKNVTFRKIFKIFFKADIILYQSNKEIFEELSKKAIFFPNGVDIAKFNPVSRKEKMLLRKKFGVPEDKFVVLHVGHIYKKRNLGIFNEIQKMDAKKQVVIVGGDYLELDEKLLKDLEKNNCRVITEYLPHIEEIYALSDCYVFPVLWGNTINMPLSILEALASNLPCISLNDYKFPYEFHKSIYYVNKTDDIPLTLKLLEKNIEEKKQVFPREHIANYSWKNLTKLLENIYKNLL